MLQPYVMEAATLSNRDCYPMHPGGPRYVRLVARSGLRRALARR